ncbi:MAG: hypothetical protein ACI4WH_06560 [Oscillospiraceae bacterium]
MFLEMFSCDDDFDYNEQRAEILAKKFNFDFSEKYHNEIIELLQNEIGNYHEGSSEYIRFLCGYLYCIGNIQDVELIKKAKYSINMDVGCMVDYQWIENLENGSIADRNAIVNDFIDYYKNYFNLNL